MRPKNDCECESAPQTRQNLCDGVFWCRAIFDPNRNKVRNYFAICIAFERAALVAQFRSQFLVIFDDPVVNKRYVIGRVRVGVISRRRAVGRPTRMGNTNVTGRRVFDEFFNEIVEFPLGPAADQFSVIDRTNTGTIVAAVFHPPQPVDKPIDYGVLAHDSDNSTHI